MVLGGSFWTKELGKKNNEKLINIPRELNRTDGCGRNSQEKVSTGNVSAGFNLHALWAQAKTNMGVYIVKPTNGVWHAPVED